MTVNDSSSSAASPPERPGLDLLASGRLAPMPAAYLRGEHLDLLDPMGLVAGTPPVELPAPEIDRRALAEGLAVANRSYGHPAADLIAEKLAQRETRVVVTGQQPGLFGGPLYALSKAVAAARWAEELERTGTPAVAVFWVATEDHDFAEVASANLLAGPELLTVGLGDDPQPLLPVGMRTLGEPLTEVFRRLREGLPGDRAAAWLDQVERWYRPNARFGEAFSRWLCHLLGPRCPLLLDSMLPAVKEAQRPWLLRLVDDRLRAMTAVEQREALITEAGFRPQVHPQPGASPLFLLRGTQRRRIEWQGEDAFTLRGESREPRPVEELRQTLGDNPSAVSPGVLARPAIQDAILGTALQVLGPGELSYMAQVAPQYDLLGLQAPRIALRPQALILDRRQVTHLGELGITLEQLLGPPDALERALATRAGADFVTPVRNRVEGLLDELRQPAQQLDPGLASPLNKTLGQVTRALDAFGQRVAAAAVRRDEVQRRRLEALRSACLPGGKPQERTLAPLHFVARYDRAFLDAFWDQLELDPRHLQVISP